MRIIGIGIIHAFMEKHADSKQWLQAWLAEAKGATWECPSDIKKRYNSASVLDDNRIIFNVKGNNYRLEVQVSFKNQVVNVKRLGTHAEYSRWDK